MVSEVVDTETAFQAIAEATRKANKFGTPYAVYLIDSAWPTQKLHVGRYIGLTVIKSCRIIEIISPKRI